MKSPFAFRDRIRERAFAQGFDRVRFTDPRAMDDAAFRQALRGSPLKRAKRAGLLRNVCVGLGNWSEEDAVPVLKRALEDDEPLVRIAGSREAASALGARMQAEADPWVRDEIRLALGE